MGLLQTVSIGIGGMVGGGIFAVLGMAATKAGGATPVAFGIGGVIAGLTAATYARLSTRYGGGGGTVDIIDRILGIGLVTGTLNIVLWAVYIATMALYASAFANYRTALVTGGSPGPVVPRLLVAVGIVVPAWSIRGATASRALSGLGAAGCLTSLAVLLYSTANDDPLAVIALVVLLGSTLVAERFWLRNGRRPADERAAATATSR